MLNQLLAKAKQVVPAEGMGATRLLWSDREPCTITCVYSERRIVVQEDRAIRTDKNGMSESQSYDFFPDPEGSTWIFTLRKNGQWVEEGQDMKSGTKLIIGERMKHYDYSF